MNKQTDERTDERTVATPIVHNFLNNGMLMKIDTLCEVSFRSDTNFTKYYLDQKS